MAIASKASRLARALGVLLAALLSSFFLVACGFVGVDLLPSPLGTDPEAGAPEGGTSHLGDGSASVDGSTGVGGDAGDGCTDDDPDGDADGTPDCADECPENAEKTEPGTCRCDRSDVDSDADGIADCIDTCGGDDDANYVPDATCGEGYCRTTNVPSSCQDGVEILCLPGTPLAATDVTCDGVDDDCDGSADEEYVATLTGATCGDGLCVRDATFECVSGGLMEMCTPGVPAASDATCDQLDDDCSGTADEDYVAPVTTCGMGACERTGVLNCSASGPVDTCTPGTPAGSDATCDRTDDDCDGTADEGYVPIATCGEGYCRTTNTPSSCTSGVETACQPGAPRASNDATADGVDDDCDGSIDEDACVTRTDTFTYRASAYTLSPGPCTRLNVRVWGAGGAAGSNNGGAWANVTGGNGGAGGYTEYVFTGVSPTSNVQVLVGRGGQGCGQGGGTNPNTTYKGGAGNTSNGGNGAAGADGSVAGGTGAVQSGIGGNGGNGFFGGGGGGAGGRLYTEFGPGGDGGAASVVFVDSSRALAGGGGGGGGAGATGIASGANGGNGGIGCSGNGVLDASQGGGGGGGGVCQGIASPPAGSGRLPYDPGGGVLPAGLALGGNKSNECNAGGNGYVIVTYEP